MAGHSKWANIKFRKAAKDSKKGKIFTKLSREITVATRSSTADTSTNARLRAAIDKALAHNMTKDAIDRAIKRGTGDNNSQALEEIRYEGYGPYGVAILVDCMTDNRNRTVSQVRHAFSQLGGNLATAGSVSYMFNKIGQIILTSALNQAQAMELAIDAGATEVDITSTGNITIETPADHYLHIKHILEQAGFQAAVAELTMVANNAVPLDIESSKTILKLIDTLEDLDDVQTVYSNADLAEEIIQDNAYFGS